MQTPYKKLDLIQGTDEWLKARYDFVTASQVPVLLHLSPYQTPLQLFEEKTMREQLADNSGKEILFQRGHNAEKAAREYLEKLTGETFEPCVLASVAYPHLLASLDGFSEKSGTIFEAKFVGAEALAKIKKGEIPAHHIAQVQAALLVSGAFVCKYFATDPTGDSAVVDVLPDLDYQAEIVTLSRVFFERVKDGEAPDPSDKDYFTPQNDERFLDLQGLKEQLDFMQAKYDALKASVTDAYKDHKRVKYGNVTITRSVRKGNIDYKKVPVLKGIDLEKYRGRSTEVVTVRIEQKAKLERVA
jgi:putative phage-type endonuclease